MHVSTSDSTVLAPSGGTIRKYVISFHLFWKKEKALQQFRGGYLI